MASKKQTPRKFVLVSKSPKIKIDEFAEYYTLYQKAIFMSLERQGLLTTAQRDVALTEIDKIPRKSG